MAASTAPQVGPGLAIIIPIGQEFAVGLVTHSFSKKGELVWISRDLFAEAPTQASITKITRWRWPVFLPVKAVVQRHIFASIDGIVVPSELRTFPLLRSKHPVKNYWTAVLTLPTGETRVVGETTDHSIPINSIVNDTRLVEMITSGWTPEERW